MKKIIFIIAVAVFVYGCFKDDVKIANSVTTIEGYVFDSLTRDTLPNVVIAIFETSKASFELFTSIDTIILSNSNGYYSLSKKFEKYNKYNYYLGPDPNSHRYGLDDVLPKIKIAQANKINLAYMRNMSYCFINGLVVDNKNIAYKNCNVKLFEVSLMSSGVYPFKSTKTDSLGKFEFEFQWSDTSRLAYKLNVPADNTMKESEYYEVKWGVDNFYTIRLNPLK